MGERTYTDLFGETVVITDAVYAMILRKHPEVSDFVDRIDRTLAEPDEVRYSVRDKRSVLYYLFEDEVLGGKWVVVVVKRIDRNFISTIYATDKIKSGIV